MQRLSPASLTRTSPAMFELEHASRSGDHACILLRGPRGDRGIIINLLASAAADGERLVVAGELVNI